MKEFKTDNYLVTIKESDEKEPLGIIIDVWDRNENLIDTFSFLNEDVKEEKWARKKIGVIALDVKKR